MKEVKVEELDTLFAAYQASCSDTNKYPEVASDIMNSEHIVKGAPQILQFLLTGSGIAGETGEVLEKFKKTIRDGKYTITEDGKFVINPSYKEFLIKEFGDLMYYVGQAMLMLDIKMSDVLKKNLNKIHSRQAEGKIEGDGDER